MPDVPQLTHGILALSPDGNPVTPAGELGLQARVSREGRTALFDDLFDADARWQVISTVGDPRAELDEHRLRFLDRLGAVFAHIGIDGGDAIDVEGRYRDHFRARGIGVLITRPDFYVFGGTPSLSLLPSLVDELERRLIGRDCRPGVIEQHEDHVERELATTKSGTNRL
jgi:hypothetical protein